jgi:hypothetical protein
MKINIVNVKLLNMFGSLLKQLYDSNELDKEVKDAYYNLSKYFNYSPKIPEIKVVNIPKFFRYIIDPIKGVVYTFLIKIGGIFDGLKNKIYLNKDEIKEKCNRIAIIYHELTHKFLDRFNLPNDVEEGYASWLTKKLTGYAKDAYGKLRERFENVYQKLGNKIFNPNYREEIIYHFYENTNPYLCQTASL